MSRICLVGAGNIARVHAAAIATLPGHAVGCVVDPDPAAARRLAAACGGAGVGVFASLDAALDAAPAGGGFDRAHVLTPPGTHADLAGRLLAAGRPVLVEKPLATSAAECAALLAAAAGGSASGEIPLGVNQNFVHHPALARLRARLDSGAVGRPRAVLCVYHVALRQLAARQLGHWMFDTPANLLLEQAVHPLSQIAILAGPIGAIQAIAAPPIAASSGRGFGPALSASLDCAHLPAQLRLAVGEAFPFWQVTVLADDGVLVADILANRLLRHGRTRWLEAVDGLLSGLATAGGLALDSLANAGGYAASTLLLQSRNDPFFRSMRDSIAAFHAAVDGGRTPALDGRFGAGLVDACLRLAGSVAPLPAAAPAAPAIVAQAGDAPADVAVLGGTGFIGGHLVADLLAHGARVAVMARSVRNLPAPFDDPRVRPHRGDIRDPAAVRAAVGAAPVVVNLAHGGGGAGFEEIRAAMLGGAEVVAAACLDRGARLVHVGSIASLYLGPQDAPVTGATPPDPRAARRADYARAKALTDRRLLDLHATRGLRVVILRPGLVVGAGGPWFHGGLGFANTEQHCIGWNAGRNPLPFVLVGDVAAAIRLACAAPDIEGRCYNLVGDARLSARDYIAAMAHALGRPLMFHPQSPHLLWAGEMGKWLIKRAGGRAVPPPSLRDLISRGMRARFDCTDAARDLGWRPVADPDRFLELAVRVHAAG
jgi:nucleoside-diphosphate-sugar epimerase/predicted dehydrogenase